jgi:putative phosphoesterase
MRIAVISDVHANLPALEAVYQHITEQQPDIIHCLGDLVNQNVWNNEVISFIRNHNIPCVLGNHDEGIGNNKAIYPFIYASREEINWGLEAISYTLQQVTDENKAYLRSFPLKRQIELETIQGSYKIVLAHGSPTSNKQRLYSFYTDAELNKILFDENAQTLIIGNTHAPRHRIIKTSNGNENYFKHLINPGSVGSPKDGSWRASYAIVSVDPDKDLWHDPDAIGVKFYKIDYDIGVVMRAIKKSPLSVYYAGRLLKQS